MCSCSTSSLSVLRMAPSTLLLWVCCGLYIPLSFGKALGALWAACQAHLCGACTLQPKSAIFSSLSKPTWLHHTYIPAKDRHTATQ